MQDRCDRVCSGPLRGVYYVNCTVSGPLFEVIPSGVEQAVRSALAITIVLVALSPKPSPSVTVPVEVTAVEPSANFITFAVV